MRPRDTRTEKERVKGRFQRYYYAGYSPFHTSGKNLIPRAFRAAGEAPVKGGRWGVRKIVSWQRDGRYWEAYNKGSARALTSRFHTQSEAMFHAVQMANLVKRIRK